MPSPVVTGRTPPRLTRDEAVPTGNLRRSDQPKTPLNRTTPPYLVNARAMEHPTPARTGDDYSNRAYHDRKSVTGVAINYRPEL